MATQVYLFHGEDAFAIAEARAKLEREILDPAWRDFNLTVLPPDAPGRKIVEALLAMPFGGGQRLVVLKEPAFLASGKAEDPSLADFERLLESGWPTGSVLLLQASKLDGRMKLVKQLAKVGHSREFAAIKPWQVEEQLGPWVAEQVARRKRQIAPDAVSALLAAVGADRQRLSSEIEKLTTYAAEGTRITPEQVRELVAGGDVEVFALTDALAKKRLGEALVLLDRLLTSDHALKVLAAVVTILRGWLRLKQLAATGLDAAAIAKAIAARSDFKVRKDLEQIRAWQPAELERALALLLELDLAVKTGRWPPEHHRLLWERTLAEMLAPAAPAR